MPTVTIGIPTYNRPEQLERALRSACRQDYPGLKIIVSDNGEAGEAVVNRLQDQRIEYFKQPRNLGLIGNLVWLLDKADTEYFMWLGDDDAMSSTDYISRLIERFQKDTSAKIVFPEFDVSYGDTTSANILAPHFSCCVTDLDYLTAWCKFGGGHPSYGLYRTEHLRKLDPANTMYIDWAYYNEGIFLHRAFIEGGMRFCPDAKLIYNGENSGTKVRSRTMFASFMRYTAETHKLYLSSARSMAEKAKLLRLVGASHYPYIWRLAKKSLRNEFGG